MESVRLVAAGVLFVAAIVVGRTATDAHSRMAAAADAAGVLAFAGLDNTPAPEPKPAPDPEPKPDDGGDAGSASVPEVVPPKPKAVPSGCRVTPEGKIICPVVPRQSAPQYRRGVFPLFR